MIAFDNSSILDHTINDTGCSEFCIKLLKPIFVFDMSTGAVYNYVSMAFQYYI